MLIITRCAVIHRVDGIIDAEEPGTFRLIFRDKTFVRIRSGHDMRLFTAYFGCKDGESIQKKIRGLKIVYLMTEHKELRGFTPADDWEGPDLGEGGYFIDRDCCC